ncbi:flagellar assembly protein FliW [Agromyces humi]|uniref:flagellar assembly protein FliW n=1 Tax=Agromyces humi TaxID=1766800 RepID=UPI001358F935|nr:flagellar assembly protein FliW [Agromyces humi]
MSKKLSFIAPMPGLGDNLTYTLDEIEGAEGLYRFDGEGGVGFYAIAAADHLPTYKPAFDEFDLEALGAAPEDVEVFVIANSGAGELTVNLLAPVAVYQDRALQVILDGQDFPMRATLSYA